MCFHHYVWDTSNRRNACTEICNGWFYLPHKVEIGENERLPYVKSQSNDVFSILPGQSHCFLHLEIFPQSLLVVSQLNHQRHVESLLEPLGDDEGNQVAQVHGLWGRSPASVQIERLPLFLERENRVEIPMGEEDPSSQEMMTWFSCDFLEPR